MSRSWHSAAVAAAAAVVLAGCGSSGEHLLPPGPTTPTVPPGPAPSPQPAGLPEALVGTWNGDDSDGRGSWFLAITQDGRYRLANETKGVTIDGTVTANDRQVQFAADGGSPYTERWSVSGGRLSLDGDVYVRVGAPGPDSTAEPSVQDLLGKWTSEDDINRTLVLTRDGRFALGDDARGFTQGTFTADGRRLTLAGVSFAWQVDGSELRLTRPDGRVSTYTR